MRWDRKVPEMKVIRFSDTGGREGLSFHMFWGDKEGGQKNVNFLQIIAGKIASISFSFLKDFIYLFLEKGEGRERERETLMGERASHQLLPVWAPAGRPAHQACAPTRNRTGDLSLCGTTPN